MSIDLEGLHASVRLEIAFEGCDRKIELGQELSRESRIESVSELDRVVLRARASSAALLDSFELEARLGNVTIASTSPEGPGETLFERIGETELATRPFTPFSDAAGASSLEITIRQRGDGPALHGAAAPRR